MKISFNWAMSQFRNRLTFREIEEKLFFGTPCTSALNQDGEIRTNLLQFISFIWNNKTREDNGNNNIDILASYKA